MSIVISNEYNRKQKNFLKQFPLKLCNIKATCEAVKINRSTYYDWMQKNISFAEEIDNIREGLYDDVESLLYKKMFEDNNTNAILFFMKTKLKKRGYGDRKQEEYEPSVVEVDDLSHLSDEELVEMLKRYE